MGVQFSSLLAPVSVRHILVIEQFWRYLLIPTSNVIVKYVPYAQQIGHVCYMPNT